MTGLLLAFLSFFLLILLAVLFLRRYRGRKYFFPLLGAFLLSACFYSAAFFSFPEEPDIAPRLNFLNGLLILALLFHGFWDTLYTSFITGFSSGLLVRLLNRGAAGMSEEELLEIYGGKTEASHLLTHRLDNLTVGGYLRREGDSFKLLPKGRFFALLTRAVQKTLNMGAGG